MNGYWFSDDNNKHAQDDKENSLSIKKILKRLNDLESIVQEQENLLAEQVIIIKSNNERICMLERIVEEHVESLVENIISIERNVEEQRELLDETIDKIIIDHAKNNTIVSTVSKLEKLPAEEDYEVEETIETKEFEIDGVLYLKCVEDGAIYDRETDNFIGMYNEETKTIDKRM
jgi:hypothetical protein